MGLSLMVSTFSRDFCQHDFMGLQSATSTFSGNTCPNFYSFNPHLQAIGEFGDSSAQLPILLTNKLSTFLHCKNLVSVFIACCMLGGQTLILVSTTSIYIFIRQILKNKFDVLGIISNLTSLYNSFSVSLVLFLSHQREKNEIKSSKKI